MLKLASRVAGAAFWYLMVGVVSSLSAPRDEPIKATEQIKKSMLAVVCIDEEDTHRTRVVGIAGSGFFTDRLGTFLTASHVLDELPNIARVRRPCTSAVSIPIHRWGPIEHPAELESFKFSNCIRDAALDLAICKLLENPFTRTRIENREIMPITFDTRKWSDGTPVALTGFPLEYAFPITSRGHIATKIRIGAEATGFDYVVDKEALPGNAGGAVYLPNGKVIGIIVKGGIKEAPGLASARSADVVIDFLSKSLP